MLTAEGAIAMSFDREKKKNIILYMLEKIDRKDSSVVKKTADAFGTTPATIYKYIDELIGNGILEKKKRGQYELVRTSPTFSLKRSAGDLTSEQAVFDRYIKPNIEGFSKNIKDIWEYISGEMVNNIIDHSEAENVSVIFISDFLKTRLVLLDDGVGIFEKIRNYFDLDSIDDAVSELFKGKVTTDSANHSGEGIFFSSRIADSFVIISSDKIFTHSKFDTDGLQNYPEAILSGKGTSVVAELSNWTKKKIADIFREYEDDDGEFTKTKISIDSYFDGAPVSRSQAKRLCNRLQNFKEVELNFAGIEWMGQGFAHQLFVVYQRATPGVRLLPVNMNEAVQRMYNHVTNS